jgi:hypothetical protein
MVDNDLEIYSARRHQTNESDYHNVIRISPLSSQESYGGYSRVCIEKFLRHCKARIEQRRGLGRSLVTGRDSEHVRMARDHTWTTLTFDAHCEWPSHIFIP